MCVITYFLLCKLDNIYYLYYIMENELDHINLINTLKERINLLEEKVVDLTGQLQEKDYNLLYTKEELEEVTSYTLRIQK